MGSARAGWLFVLLSSGCDCYSSAEPDDDDDGIWDQDAAVSADAGRDAGSMDAGVDGGRDAGAESDAAVDPDGGAPDASAGDDGGVVAAPELVQLDLGISFGPVAAIDGAGNATVVWADALGVVAKRWESGAWLDTEVLGSGDGPRTDFNLAGQGVATWRDTAGEATAACLFEPGVGWLAAGSIGPGGNGYTGEVAIDGSGNVVALFDWSYSDDHRVRTVRYEPATGWGEPALVEAWDVYTRMPDVAANDAGDFAGVWTHFEADAETTWASREVGGWEPPVLISGDSTFDPQVTVDGVGNALAVWGSNDGISSWLRAAWQPIGGAYGEAEIVGGFDGGLSLSLSTAFDGSSFAAWEDGTDVRVARREPAGGWEAAESLDALGVGSTTDSVAVAAHDDGGAVVAWAESEGGLSHVRWSRYVAGEGWTDATELPAAFGGRVSALSMDAAPDGTAILAWQVSEGDSFHVWATVLPLS